jgi:hypothetical protein
LLHSLIIKKSVIVCGETAEVLVEVSKRVLLSKNSLFTKLVKVCNWLLKLADEPVRATLSPVAP